MYRNCEKATFGRFWIHPWTVCSTRNFLCSDWNFLPNIDEVQILIT